jgi:uncharacterized protein (UPF0332 family)
LNYVVNSLYYAFYYPALALLHTKGIPAAMQSVSAALFEREFIKTGEIDQRFFRALRRLFELKPKCSTPQLNMISRDSGNAADRCFRVYRYRETWSKSLDILVQQS